MFTLVIGISSLTRYNAEAAVLPLHIRVESPNINFPAGGGRNSVCVSSFRSLLVHLPQFDTGVQTESFAPRNIKNELSAHR